MNTSNTSRPDPFPFIHASYFSSAQILWISVPTDKKISSKERNNPHAKYIFTNMSLKKAKANTCASNNRWKHLMVR